MGFGLLLGYLGESSGKWDFALDWEVGSFLLDIFINLEGGHANGG